MKLIKAHRVSSVEDGLKILSKTKIFSFKEDIEKLLFKITNSYKDQGITEEDVAHSLAYYLERY
jgi:hypothetical protein